MPSAPWTSRHTAAALAGGHLLIAGAPGTGKSRLLNGTLLPEVAESVLAKMAEGAAIARIKVSADKKGQFKYTIK